MNSKTTATSIVSAALALLFACSTHAADEPAGATPGDPIAELFSKGKVSLAVRPRAEIVDQSNRRDTDAYTIRTTLGFTTGSYHGITAMLEAENVAVLPGSDYADYPGASPNADSRAVIPDPEGTEINQAWVAYKAGAATLKAGRVNLVLDNARFIGNVGWRQNNQTFDAVTLQGTASHRLSYTYGYIAHVNRIFGDDIPGGDWSSDSHVANLSCSALPIGTLTGYAYLLDFDNAAASSCATYGLSLAGSRGKELKFGYRAEYAWQSDYGASTLDYSTDYLLLEATLGTKAITGGIGYEQLGMDNNVGFKTPLATLHAFNGWADVFLNTPGAGLRDAYARLSTTLAGVGLLAVYHQFETDTGVDLGEEIDLQASYVFSKQLSGLVKYASFSSDSTSYTEVHKFWVQLEFKY